MCVSRGVSWWSIVAASAVERMRPRTFSARFSNSAKIDSAAVLSRQRVATLTTSPEPSRYLAV
ncbi:MAG: hypothetical protein ACYC35_28920 [Pirellulales bacterium]